MKEQKTMIDNRFLEQAIAGMGAGSTKAFALFYEQAKTSVYAFALSITGNAHAAEDVMQETYLRVFSAADSYKPMGKPTAWLLTIARNLSLMHPRSERQRFSQAEESASPLSFELHSIEQLSLQEALGSLQRNERETVTLHAIAGLKHREIAAMLDLPLPTVLSQYHRALSKLRTLLKEEG